MDDEQLISACLKCDQRAFRTFFDRYYNQVYKIAYRYLLDIQSSEDVVIVTFNKAFDSLKSFEYRGPGSIGKWLNTITINESIKVLRKNKPVVFLENINEIPQNQPLKDYPIDLEEIKMILNNMPDGYRRIFNLYAIDGYSHSQIADLLSISRNTSKSQLRKARRYIINELHKNKEYGT